MKNPAQRMTSATVRSRAVSASAWCCCRWSETRALIGATITDRLVRDYLLRPYQSAAPPRGRLRRARGAAADRLRGRHRLGQPVADEGTQGIDQHLALVA